MSDGYFSVFQGDVILLPPPGRNINWPTEEGRDVGKILADAIQCPTHQMCTDCVFRHGSFPNQCESTLDDAMSCMIDPKENGKFLCNHPDDGGETRVCGGYKHALTKIDPALRKMFLVRQAAISQFGRTA